MPWLVEPRPPLRESRFSAPDDAQEALPESEHFARHGHFGFPGRRRVDEALEELQDGGEAELLRLGGAGALVDAEMQHRVGRAGMQAAAA